MRILDERREDERIKCDRPILHNTIPPDFFYRGTMYNYSKGGMYFESNEDLAEGDHISISIKNPPQKLTMKSQKYLDVEIIWCKLLQGSSYQIGYGARLISVPSERPF